MKMYHRSVVTVVCASLGVALMWAGGGGARAEAPDARVDPLTLPVVQALPYARLLAEGGTGGQSAERMRANADGLLRRLLIGDAHPALDTPQDMLDLLSLAVELQALEAHGEDSLGFWKASTAAAYLLHTLGYAYETRPRTRAAFDAMGESARAGDREAVDKLVASVRGAREVGRRWFPRALFEVMKRDPKDAAAHDQRGLWLMREGRAEDAAVAFAQAFTASENVEHALHLYEALLRTQRLDQAEELRRNMLRLAPALAGRMDELVEAESDRVATAAFEARPSAPTLEEGIAQLRRYMRATREPAADVLLVRLQQLYPDDPRTRHAAAMLWLHEGSFERLQRLFAEAEAAGAMDDKLREARVVAVARLRVARAVGQASHPLAEADAEGDLKALAAGDAERYGLIAEALRVLPRIGRWMGARQLANPGEAPPRELGDAVREATAVGLKAFPRSPEMLTMAAAAQIGIDDADGALTLLRRKIKAMPKEARPKLTFLLARAEVGYGVRRRDARLLAAGLERLVALAAGPGVPQAELAYARTVAALAAQVLDGGVLPLEAGGGKLSVAEALDAMPRLDLDFDDATTSGLWHEVGVATTVGALLLAADRGDLSANALWQVRRLMPHEPLAKLAGGVAALLGKDVQGALSLLTEALERSDRPQLEFAARKWSAYVGNAVGMHGMMERHMATMLEGWEEAGQPDVVKPRSPRPLFIGDFNVGVEFEVDAPLQLQIRADPLVLLLPDFPHDRAEVRAIAKDGGGAP